MGRVGLLGYWFGLGCRDESAAAGIHIALSRHRTPCAAVSLPLPEHLARIGHQPVQLLDITFSILHMALHLHDKRITLLRERHVQPVTIVTPTRRRPLLGVALLEALLVCGGVVISC